MDRLALLEGVQLHGTGAHHLEDDGDGARLPVIARDGQRNALGIFPRAHDDELSGLRLFGNERGVDPQFGDGGVQFPPFQDGEQSDPLLRK